MDQFVPNHQPLSPARLLVVDDERSIRDICQRVLLRHGYQVTVAEDGLAALDSLESAPFDLVLTDIEMPRMGGLELLGIMRERYPDIDVVIFTAHTTVETARDTLKQGAFDYLHKAQIVDDLPHIVERVLEWRRVQLEKQRLSELVALYDLSQTFTRTLDTGTAVREIVRMLWQRFSPRALSLSLLHPQDDELELLAQRGEPIDAAPGWRSLVMEQDEHAILAGHDDLVGLSSGHNPSHVACLTLRTSDRPVGVLRLVRGPDQPGFAADDRKLLVVWASQIAASLENIRLYQQLKEQNLQIISAFADMIDARDPYTRGHSEQVTRYATRLAEVIGFLPQQVERIKYGALLHDIGKIGVRDSVLLKAGPLDKAELEQVRQHPQIGVGILKHIKSLADVLPMIQAHHERLDGKGYPDGQCSTEIPIEAKIIAIADAFDAMTTNRSYRQAMRSEEAIRVLLRGRGLQWDAHLVDAFVAMIEQEGDGLLVSEARPPQPTFQPALATAPMAD